jgi:hypothetical protein
VVVEKTSAVEIPTPVVTHLPAVMTKDCAPQYRYPADDVTIAAVLDRLEAVEIALAICRNQLEVIRAAQP